MADAEREARIKITTVSDNSGLQKTKEELEEFKKRSEELMKQSDQSAKSTSDLTEKKKNLRDAVKGLALEVPGLARVIGLLSNPLTIVSAALGVAAGKMLDWKRSIEEAAQKRAELESIADTIKSLERSIAEFTMEAFADELKRGSESAKSTGDQIKRLNEEIEFNNQLQDQLQDKGLALGKARIKERVARGEITEVQGMELAMGLEDQVRQDKLRREEAGEASKLSNMAFALKRTEGVTPISPEAMAQAQREMERQAALAGASQSDFGKFSVENRKRIADLGAEMAAARGVGELPGVFDLRRRRLTRSNEEAFASIEGDVTTAEQEFTMQERMNEDRQRQADRARRNFEAMQAEQARRRSIIEMRGPLQEEFDTLSRRSAARRGANRQGAQIERATGAATVGAAQAEASADAAREARQFQQQQDSKVNSAVREALKGKATSELIDQLMDILHGKADVDDKIINKVNRLEQRIADQRVD